MSRLLGVDTGGTFTDFVLSDGVSLRTHKVLSTPQAPEQAILQGIQEMGLSMDGLHVIHGSTVATNAVLEGKLARTVYITNKGLKDTLTIGRQARRALYELQPEPVSPPVPSENCLEVACRTSAHGETLAALHAEDLVALQRQVDAIQPDAIAINLLFSFIDDEHERLVEQSLAEGRFVTRSSSLLPVYREYERGIATWLNAAIGPLMKRYLDRLSEQLSPATLTIMQSSGDTIDAVQAAKTPANLLLSGPAGGLMGARSMAGQAGFRRLMTFDMGGTSSDVALINGNIQLTDEGRIAGYPVALPMVDMHTIGAGGGSLAWIDEGGMLQVGPQSAGASPGPACYGQGGKQPTVTDANVVLGHLPALVSLGGKMSLDHAAALSSVGQLAQQMGCDVEQAAQGILLVANEHMARALRVISIERGHDPAEFTLASFGGAGGLHACDLAEALGVSSVFIPMHAGVLSALGMLAAPRGRHYMRTCMQPLGEIEMQQIEQVLHHMQDEGRQALMAEGLDEQGLTYEREADIRYIGQSSTLRVAWGPMTEMHEQFQVRHARRYGHTLDEPTELVNLHVSVRAPVSMPGLPVLDAQGESAIAEQVVYGVSQPALVYDRSRLAAGQQLRGPLLLIEPSATTWVKSGWEVQVDQYGNLVLTSAS
jgi:N-methylhydantoinase A